MSLFASNPSFRPTEVTRFVDKRDTGAGTILVETDAGLGYLKALGNPDGPHALVKEFVGTRMAARLGLATFDYALIEITELDELPFFQKGKAKPGPAFITRAEEGQTWDGRNELLEKIDNPGTISGLIIVDTWLRNTDRYHFASRRVKFDNVFFSSESSTELLSLRAMDFSHCIQYGGELTEDVLTSIHNQKDDSVFGRFTQFAGKLDRQEVKKFASTLKSLSRSDFQKAVDLLPEAWNVDQQLRDALVDFLAIRAVFVGDNIEVSLFGLSQKELDLPGGGDS